MYEHGGECFVNAHVNDIIIKNNKAVGVRVCKATSWENSQKTGVDLPEVTDIYAPVIINATGIQNMYNRLLPQDLPVVKDFHATNKTIPSYGHNYLFVAIKGMHVVYIFLLNNETKFWYCSPSFGDDDV